MSVHKKPQKALRAEVPLSHPKEGLKDRTPIGYRGLRRYNPAMPHELFEDMKRYVGFSEADARALVEAKTPLFPYFSQVVETFYDTLNRHPRARAVFAADLGMIERLKKMLFVWLGELFDGRYDDGYFERRCRIGRTHVRVDLPQHYMFTAMNVIRVALATKIEELDLPDRVEKLKALHKILDLELGIMNETYREDLVSRLYAVEHAHYEAKLSKSEHLAAVGELAASLAHEIKNPLAGISGAIQILGKEMDDDHPHKEIIAESLRQIDRLDGAVKDLLIYARPKPPVTARTPVDQLLQRTLVLLREEPAFRGVNVKCDASPDDPTLEIDEMQIQQVLTNLLINAAHACQNGGSIYCRVVPTETSTRIVIEDDGIGMTSNTLGRAFEPFYTTKAKGTGLGLAICKRIVESHGGSISLESQPGRGTCVTVELPEKP